MTKLSSVKTIWDTLTEVDLTPLKEEALRGVNIALVGNAGSGRSRLAYQMRRDPNHPEMRTQTPVFIHGLDEVAQTSSSDLVIIMVDEGPREMTREHRIAEELINNGQKVLVFINHYADIQENAGLSTWSRWDTRHILYGDVNEVDLLSKSFVPAVMALLPEDLSPLARAFPLFRVPVAHQMINDTCLSNAAYSLSTGLAGIVPGLGIPLTVADIFVLTKMQAFMVYKLGLALGYSTRWQDYAAEFGGVLGGGFLWRQIARSLVGLIPVYGIIPKVAVTYAGTYVVGQVVLRWYLTGRHVTADEMKVLFSDALRRGRDAARRLLRRKKKSEKRKSRLLLPGSQD